MNNRSKFCEQGNVFIIILVAIALFAALSFTVLRGNNNKSDTLLADRQAQLAASEIIDYAQKVTRGVAKVRENNCSDDMVSFEPPPFDGSTGYDNVNAPGDKTCHIFHQNGGSVSYRTFPADWREGGSGELIPVFTGSSCIPSVGTGDDGSCMGDGNENDSELMMVISNLKDKLCQSMRKNLNFPLSSASVMVIFDETPFNGTYQDIKVAATDTSELQDDYTGHESSCIEVTSSENRIFYKVLLAR